MIKQALQPAWSPTKMIYRILLGCTLPPFAIWVGFKCQGFGSRWGCRVPSASRATGESGLSLLLTHTALVTISNNSYYSPSTEYVLPVMVIGEWSPCPISNLVPFTEFAALTYGFRLDSPCCCQKEKQKSFLCTFTLDDGIRLVNMLAWCWQLCPKLSVFIGPR